MGSSARLFRQLLSTVRPSVQLEFVRHFEVASTTPVAGQQLLGIKRTSFDFCNNEGTLRLQNANWPEPLLLHPTWLRDHCRCPACFDGLTNHKMVDIASLNLDIQPKHVHLDATRLHVTWPDGHRSSYDTDWLWQNVYTGYKTSCRARKSLWGGLMDSMTLQNDVVLYDDFMHSEDALKTVLQALAVRGFALIQKVPQSIEATKETAERVCPLRLGFFGKILEFQSNMLHHPKLQVLPNHHNITPHTDQSYLTEPAGIKVQNCLSTNNQMYISLVDGFNAAEELKKTNPEAYRTLAELPLVYEYNDDKFHHKCSDAILKHDAVTGQLSQIKYNMYYRSALSTIPFEDMDRFYSALHAFSKIVQNSHLSCRIQPLPGTFLLIDNWRILSKMSRFDDENIRMAGCYLGWSDYMCRARRLMVVP